MNMTVMGVNSALLMRTLLRGKRCSVCNNWFPYQGYSNEKMTATCKHEALKCCNYCVADSIARQLNAKGPERIKCDFDGCKSMLSRDDVLKWADHETIAFYEELCTGCFTRCISCKKGQVHADDWYNPKVTCTNCGEVYCYDHRVKWHKFHRCDLINAYAKSKRGALKLLVNQVLRQAKKFVNHHLHGY